MLLVYVGPHDAVEVPLPAVNGRYPDPITAQRGIAAEFPDDIAESLLDHGCILTHDEAGTKTREPVDPSWQLAPVPAKSEAKSAKKGEN